MTKYGKSGLLAVFAVSIALSASAQTAVDSSSNSKPAPAVARPMPIRRPIVKRPKPITQEISGGFRLNTDGWSIFLDKGKIKTDESGERADRFYNVRILQVELSEKKDPREVKSNISEQSTIQTKPYIFGKINNFYNLKFGYGYRKMIAGKPEPGTVAIHWVYLAGISLGLEKPYYVDAYVPQDNGGPLVEQSVSYYDDSKGSFLNNQLIIGSSGFAKGLGDIKIVPGIHAKTGLHFDFAPGRKGKMAVETGVSGDLYTRGIEMIANQKARPYFVNIYAGIQIGGRK